MLFILHNKSKLFIFFFFFFPPPKTARPGGPVSVLRTTRSLLQHKVAGVGQRRDDLCLERALAGAGRRPSEPHGDPGRSRAAA